MNIVICHLLSSKAMDLVIRHMSLMMLMLTITNRDQTRRKKLLNQPNQSLSSGAQYRFGQAKQFWYFSYLQYCEYVWVCHVVLMVMRRLIKRRRTVQAVSTSWSQLHKNCVHVNKYIVSVHTQIPKKIQNSNTKYNIIYAKKDCRYGFWQLIKDSWKP